MKGIDVGKLEKELSALWAEEGRAQREGAQASVTRACVLNLVAWVESAEQRAALDEVLGEVVERHPCRALLLVAERAATEERLDAYVSMRCQLLQRGGKQICGEEVTIEAGGPTVESLASAVAPLLVPDVPVFLWWRDLPHEDDRLFARLASMSDRVVVDSAACDRPRDGLLRLARMLEAGRIRARLTDVNWGRLTSWRNLVASFWDVSSYREHLNRLSLVRISYVPPRVAPKEAAAQAWLLAGWLASRLGWEVEGRKEDEEGEGDVEGKASKFVLKASDGRPVVVDLRACDGPAECDGRVSALAFADEEADAQFHVEYRPEMTKLETGARLGGRLLAGRVLAYEARTEGRRLSAELDILSRDPVYEQAARAAARLAEALPAPPA
ncbi:MAG TPA: glucose-6-phosphate dehydrogenase assembly protein OpcA [Pyrinomonadaceae bacterium]|nr:glucose-6-phosphate dehydrogenase assembly protein OpcA [Pyrinomonadaceae bacterium]